jgi:hypothetical protein
LARGGRGNKKQSDVRVSKYFFWRLRKNSRGFFYRVVFLLPLLLVTKRPKTRSKKLIKTTEGGGGETEGKKNAFFVMSPDGLFREKNIAFLEPPLSRNAQKHDK